LSRDERYVIERAIRFDRSLSQGRHRSGRLLLRPTQPLAAGHRGKHQSAAPPILPTRSRLLPTQRSRPRPRRRRTQPTTTKDPRIQDTLRNARRTHPCNHPLTGRTRNARRKPTPTELRVDLAVGDEGVTRRPPAMPSRDSLHAGSGGRVQANRRCVDPVRSLGAAVGPGYDSGGVPQLNWSVSDQGCGRSRVSPSRGGGSLALSVRLSSVRRETLSRSALGGFR